MNPTPELIRKHVALLKEATDKDLDELLIDLLVHNYSTRRVQDS